MRSTRDARDFRGCIAIGNELFAAVQRREVQILGQENIATLQGSMHRLRCYMLNQDYNAVLGIVRELKVIDLENLWLLALEAHAQWALGRRDTAAATYQAYKGKKLTLFGLTTDLGWEDIVLASLDSFARHNVPFPDADKIKAIFGQAPSVPDFSQTPPQLPPRISEAPQTLPQPGLGFPRFRKRRLSQRISSSCHSTTLM